jgi:predicted Zn-dependent protease
MGLMLMAKAGYDPSAAPRFWGRFASAHQGAGAPEFFSTHPADERRSADLQTALPEAVALYQSAPAQFGLGERIAANTPQAQPVRLSGQQTPAPSVSRAPAASSGAGQPPVRGR